MAVPVDRGGRALHRGRGRPATTMLVGLMTACTLLASCGNSEDAPTSVEPTPDASDPGAPAFPAGTGLQTSRASRGAPLVFTGVRLAEHRGFDRIVLELAGTGTPGWAVGYVDEAVVEGSGDVVALDGDSILDIHASHTTWPAPDYYDDPRRLRGRDGSLTEVYAVGTVEGYTQVLAGIDGPRAPFRVVARSDPSRLVIDVAARPDQ